MKRIMIAVLLVLFVAGCAGKYDWDTEQDMRGQRRMDCTGTKTTNEAANVTNCPQIRPDGK
jgi:PBP1b-binding outer membrane lipoprotein LpoB